MATASVTWTFTSDLQSWVAHSTGSGNLCQRSASNGHADAGCLNDGTTGKSKSGTGYFDLTGTWEAIFGISAGSHVTAIMVSSDGYWGRCLTYTTGAASTDGPLELRDSGGTLLLTLTTGRAYSAADGAYVHTQPTAGQQNQAIAAGQQPSNTTIALRLRGSVNTGNSVSASNQLYQDDITVTITYTPPVTGNLAHTESADTSSESGTVAWVGNLSHTESSDVGAASGGIYGSGTFGFTEANDSTDMSGTVGSTAVTGDLAANEASDAALSSGGIYGTGDLQATEEKDTPEISGTSQWLGSFAATESMDAAGSTGSVSWACSFAATEGADTPSSSGLSQWVAEFSATEAKDTVYFDGTVTIQGTLTATESQDIADFSGVLVLPDVTGDMASSESADTFLGMESLPVIGSMVSSEPVDMFWFRQNPKARHIKHARYGLHFPNG